MKVKNKMKRTGYNSSNNMPSTGKANNPVFSKNNSHNFKKNADSGSKNSAADYGIPEDNSNFKGRILELNEIIPSQYKTLDEFKKKIHEQCVKDSIKKVKENITEQDLISIYVNYMDIMDEIINSYFERVAEHFTIYYPEASIKASMLDDFLKIKNVNRRELSKLFNVAEESMGLDLKPEDINILSQTINSLRMLMEQKKVFEERIKEMIVAIAKNTSALAGEIVTARLLAAAGSMKRLMLMPSSTIQVLGAEKALFRHLRTKSSPPKHGIIFNTTYVSSAPLKHRGKIARALASKIVISIKIDYFKGKDISKELIDDLNKKIAGLKK
jgi:nucleolar protein 56